MGLAEYLTVLRGCGSDARRKARILTMSRWGTGVLNEDQVAAVTKSPVIGTIGYDRAAPPLLRDTNPESPLANDYRRLCANLTVDPDQPNRSVVITSSVEGEGATIAAINISCTLADGGRSVLLIDADLRRPTVADHLGLEQTVGLTTVIVGLATLAEVVQPVGNRGLDVLAAGQLPPNPSELLGSNAVKRLIAEATDRYDVVVIDSAPLLSQTGSAVLSTVVGGAVVVVGCGKVTRAQLASAIASLEAVGGTILGIVLNRA